MSGRKERRQAGRKVEEKEGRKEGREGENKQEREEGKEKGREGGVTALKKKWKKVILLLCIPLSLCTTASYLNCLVAAATSSYPAGHSDTETQKLENDRPRAAAI